MTTAKQQLRERFLYATRLEDIQTDLSSFMCSLFQRPTVKDCISLYYVKCHAVPYSAV